MRVRSFLLSGLCFSCFFHCVCFLLVTPKIVLVRGKAPVTESVFLGAILRDIDVMPPQAHLYPRKRPGLLPAASPGSLERFKGKERLPEKPALLLKEEKTSYPLPEAVRRGVGTAPSETLTFGFLDAVQYFVDIDFSDIAKMAARKDLSGVVGFEIFISNNGDILRLRRTAGSGDPVLDSMIAARLHKAVLKTPWAGGGTHYHLRLKLR